VSYSETDRSWIRRYVGYGAIFLQAEPRLENAISATSASTDPGGARPDSSTENNIKGIIYGFAAVTTGTSGVTPGPTPTTGVTFNTPALRGLIQIEQAIATQDTFLGTSEADGGEVKIDPVREVARLRREGRRLCHQLARMLGMRGVRADIFASAPVIKDDDPFAYDNLEHWHGP
jgi:hypothetical protein